MSKYVGLIVLLGCEESQEGCKAFRKRKHIAYSCDLKPCSGGHPEWHLQMDVFDAVKYLIKKHGRIDIAIFFPDCTFLTVSANKWLKDQAPLKSGKLVGKERRAAQRSGLQFVIDLSNLKISRIAIENPIGTLSTAWRKPDQVIQPTQFGHNETKATCLWLKNLPLLKPTNIIPLEEKRRQKSRIHKMPPSDKRSEERSKSYLGIMDAMADQWG